MQFPDIIKMLRTEQGLTQKELANKLNIVDDLQLNNRIWTKE